jgi:hypothetical protein
MIERPMVGVSGVATVTSDTTLDIISRNPYSCVTIKGISDLQCFNGKKVTMVLKVSE